MSSFFHNFNICKILSFWTNQGWLKWSNSLESMRSIVGNTKIQKLTITLGSRCKASRFKSLESSVTSILIEMKLSVNRLANFLICGQTIRLKSPWRKRALRVLKIIANKNSEWKVKSEGKQMNRLLELVLLLRCFRLVWWCQYLNKMEPLKNRRHRFKNTWSINGWDWVRLLWLLKTKSIECQLKSKIKSKL